MYKSAEYSSALPLRQWLLLLLVGVGLQSTSGHALAAEKGAKTEGLGHALAAHPEFKRKAWAKFYRDQKQDSYWLDADGGWLSGAKFSAHADALIEALKQANSHGLRSEDYALKAIKKLRAKTPRKLDVLAAAELRLMRSYLDYYQHLAQGRYPELTKETSWYITQNDYSEAEALRRLHRLGPAKALASVLPAQADYALLRAARSRMQDIVRQGGWPAIAEGPLLRPDMQSELVPVLRKRLRDAGYLAQEKSNAEPTLFDAQTVAALKVFQQQHGLQEDGILGPQGRAMLNYPAEKRLAQIDANLERLRWLPAKLADDRLVVNIAAFNLRGYRGGEELLNMRVVVGDEEHETPTFADQLDYIEVNPYWSIPNSIVINELAPKLVENIEYLEARNMQIYEGWEDDDTIDADDIDWDDYIEPDAIFPHVIKQDPGPRNALGRIKFMFPNKYSIYLHDTPEVNLFWAADRSFSHGCVRVHKPMTVADLILRNTENWDMERVKETLEDTDNTRIDLDKKDRMKVYIYYQTVWAGEAGKLFFRPDIYQRDEVLISKFIKH